MNGNKNESGEANVPITFRLYEPYATALATMATAMRAKSPHEVARMLVIEALGQASARETLDVVGRLEREVQAMRQGLALSLRAILMNLNVDLPEEQVEKWVAEKLWPGAAGGNGDQHQ